MYIRRKKKSEFFQKYTQPILEYKIDSWYESDVFPWLLLFGWFLIASSRHCNDVLLPWSWYRNCLKWKIASNAVDGTVGSRRSSFTDIFLNNVWKFPNNSTTVFYMLYWKVYNALLNLFLPKKTFREMFCVGSWHGGPLASVDVVRAGGRLSSCRWCRARPASRSCGRAIPWSRCAELLPSERYR